MGPTMPVSVPLAGGSKNAIAVCVATRCRRMRCASVVCSPGVATSSRPRTEPICLCFCSTPERAGGLAALSFQTSEYQLSNDHTQAGQAFEAAGGASTNNLSPSSRQHVGDNDLAGDPYPFEYHRKRLIPLLLGEFPGRAKGIHSSIRDGNID